MRVLRILLWLLPGDFRREYGSELLETARDRWRERGRPLGSFGRLRFWIREWLAVVRACFGVRRRRGAEEKRNGATLGSAGVVRRQEAGRDTWMWRWLDDWSRDIRYACRTMWRSPGFAVTAVLSLALGIGANAAIFSLVDQVLLRRLPVNEPERLVHLDWAGNSLSASWGSDNLLSYPLCLDVQEQDRLDRLFDGFFCRHPTTVNVTTGQEQNPVRAEIVSGSYFPVLGARPELGRLIDQSDDLQPGSHPVVVLSYDYWKNDLGSAPDVIGRHVLVNNYPMTVIGVTPASFGGVDPFAVPALWIPAMMTPQAAPLEPEWDGLLDRRSAWMHVFGRLQSGVTADEAKAGLQPWFTSMLDADTRREGFPSVTDEERRSYLASTIDVLPAARGLSNARGVLERPLLVLMGGTLLLLLLTSLDVAGLLLARGATRTRELMTRMALGASRGRVRRQLLVESALITLGGALLGLALAPTMSRVLLSFLSPDADLTPGVDLNVLLFTFAASIATGGLCGLAPAFQTARMPLIASLKDRSRITYVGGLRLRKMLVVGQVAFTLILLIGAGLFVQTLARLNEKVEFDSSNVLMLGVDPPSSGYSLPEAEQAMRELFRSLQEAPDVERVAVANTGLLTGGWRTAGMTIQAEERFTADRPVSYMRVGPGFFSTLGIQVVAGRDFDEREVRAPGSEPTRPRSVIINESFARRYFENSSAVGYHLGAGDGPDATADMEIIGVVEDFSRRSLRDEELEQVFVPFWNRDSGDGRFYVKMRGSPETAFAVIRAAVSEVDPGLPVSLRTFEDQIERSLRTERMLATLSSGFGAIALLLSVVGLYGVMSFVVTQRTQEIGVRRALGATRSAVVWLIFRDALFMTGAGIAIALPSGWALRRFVEAELFGIPPVHAPTIGLASCVLALVALGAALRAAWRAASVSPTEALRFE